MKSGPPLVRLGYGLQWVALALPPLGLLSAFGRGDMGTELTALAVGGALFLLGRRLAEK